jgi:endoglucanase
MEFLPLSRRRVLKQLALTSAAITVAPSMSACGQRTAATTSTSIFLNQVGYLPKSAKAASIAAGTGSGPASDFVLRDPLTRRPVRQGKCGAATLDEASGDMIMVADFSGIEQPGQYVLECGSGGNDHVVSDPFEIRSDVYSSALRLTMRGYYGQRCGCNVDLGGGYKHPACHLDGDYHPSSGKKGSAGNHGGWHDAGDYGRYVVNSGITCGTLLWAWELYPRTLRKLSLDIPESGGKTPDYLAEIRWNLEWMLSMQDADGGVWHKQTSEQFCAFIMPQDDHLTSYVIGTGTPPYKSTGSTADLAAVMAIAARCYGPYDDAFAQRCLAAAERAYAWITRNPNVTFKNPTGVGTGEYGDDQLPDEPLWAAAELFRTTGKPVYEQAFLSGYAALPVPLKISAPSWGDVAPLACWSYALSEHATSKQIQEQIRHATQTAAQTLIARSRSNGYGNTLSPTDYVWGSNSVAGNQSLLLLVANHLQPDPAAVDAALANLHYLLGRNCFGVSWVTQLGTRPFQHPHHRPSAADGIVAPWPGLLSGGPNARPGDAVARTLPRLSPMRMWIDAQGAYSMNEIAINWNAPLVFLLAAANDSVV